MQMIDVRFVESFANLAAATEKPSKGLLRNSSSSMLLLSIIGEDATVLSCSEMVCCCGGTVQYSNSRQSGNHVLR